jgi:hypothetical protein
VQVKPDKHELLRQTNDERKGNVQPETAKRGQRAEHGENRRGTTKIDSFATLANDYTVVHDSTGSDRA